MSSSTSIPCSAFAFVEDVRRTSDKAFLKVQGCSGDDV
jgi:hypothetical protein